MKHPVRHRTATPSFPWLILATLGLGCAFFGGLWWEGPASFGFRDAGHYYFRLFAWNQAEWEAGRVPLWNPYDNLGIPQLADGSSSALYPGKLLFWLPGASYATRFNLYVIGHVLWASLGMVWLTHRLRLPAWGRGVAVISFPFSGIMLTQTCNVVFLVGAAWLPWGLAILHARPFRPWRAVLPLACVLALMVLGGDPQMAYHLGLIAAWFALRRGRNKRHRDASNPAPRWLERIRHWGRPAFAEWLPLGCTAGLAALLAAAQLLPSLDWSRQSTRSLYERPRSLYETVPYVQRAWGGADAERVPVEYVPYEIAQGLLGEPVPNTHHDHIYQFSVPPWTLPELLWPNLSGQLFPQHERWMQTWIPGDRIWHPSLYVGIVTGLLAICGFRWQGRASSRRCAYSRVTLFALLAACGWFGVGWLLRETMWLLAGSPPDAIQLGSPTGGIYWFLVTCFPFYAQFRYPAKWMVIAACGLSVLAGLAFESRGEGTRLRRPTLWWWLVGLASSLSLLGWCGITLARPSILAWLADQPADPLFGPLLTEATWSGLRQTFLHALLVLLAGSALIVSLPWQRRRAWQHVGLACWLLLLGSDLWCSHRWVLGETPLTAWEVSSPGRTNPAISEEPPSVPRRIYRDDLGGWLPERFIETSSPDRLAEAVAWDTVTRFPKHHLALPVASVESYGSLRPADYDVFLRVARETSASPEGTRPPPLPPPVLRLLAVQELLVPDPRGLGDQQEIEVQRLEGAADAWRVQAEQATARAWLVHRVEAIDPPASRSYAELDRATKATLRPGGRWRDWSREATLEREGTSARPAEQAWWRQMQTQEDSATTAEPRESELVESERVEIMSYTPQRVVIHATCQRAALLVLSDYFQPGWEVRVEPLTTAASPQLRGPMEVWRANRVMRGVPLLPGAWELELTYQPRRFRWGRWIGGLSWGLMFALLVLQGWKRRRAIRIASPRS